MKQEEILFLNQLIRSLEEAGGKMEKASQKRDDDGVARSKKIMLQIQKEISEIIQ